MGKELCSGRSLLTQYAAIDAGSQNVVVKSDQEHCKAAFSCTIRVQMHNLEEAHGHCSSTA